MNETQSNRLSITCWRAALADRWRVCRIVRGNVGETFAVVLRILKNRGLAEDALQDVYIRIWQSGRTTMPAGRRDDLDDEHCPLPCH